MGRSQEPAGGTCAPPVSLLEISRVLDESARLLRAHVGIGGTPSPTSIDATFVRRILAARRLREEMLGIPAGDPAWAMLLELYAARLENRRLSQTGLAIAAGLPRTTVLRIARKLLARGVLTGSADPEDSRLLLLSLSDKSAHRLNAYLTAARAESPAGG